MQKVFRIRGIKTATIIMVSIALLWAGFVTVDCIRLRNAESGTRPFITLYEEDGDTVVSYTGLGYTVKYHVDIGEVTTENGITYVEQLGYGAEFWLFDKLLVWGWIE